MLLQTESRHQLLKENTCPVAVAAQAAHNVVRRAACIYAQRGGGQRGGTAALASTVGEMCVDLLTYDSEVLVEQTHVDRQEVRQPDGQAAAHTDVGVSGVH